MVNAMNPLPRLVGRLVVLAVGAGVAVFAGRAAMRAKPRACAKCGAVMKRMHDGEKQAYLEAGEKCEERVGSIAHDVWRCTGCHALEKARWPALVPKGVSACGVCRFRTMKVVSRKRAAGGIETSSQCEHCGAKESATRGR